MKSVEMYRYVTYVIRLPIADFPQWGQLAEYYYTPDFVYTVGILRENIFVKTLIFKYCWRRNLLQVDERIKKSSLLSK